MNAMLALVGRQPLPNLIPVRHYQPHTVILVYTTTTERTFTRLKDVIIPDHQVIGIKVDAYNVTDITDVLATALSDDALRESTLRFNLTGGTKAMSLAAYQIAQRQQAPVMYLESEGGQSCVYHYRWHAHQLDFQSKEGLPSCITLTDWLDVHLGKGMWIEKGAGRDEGSPFETAIADGIQPHSDEVMIGIKAMNGQIDLDVIFRHGNRVGLIEAKTGDKGRKLDGIKQLSNAGQHLGTYIQKYLVVTETPNETHEIITETSRIKTIQLPDYTLPATQLTHDDQQRLLEAL